MHRLIPKPQNDTWMNYGKVWLALAALLVLVQFIVAQTPTTKPPPAKPVPTRTEPGLNTNIGPMLEVANRPDFPLYVAGNSGQIVMVGDMQGSGWSDYLPVRATSITTDRTGTLYMADTTSLVIRDNRLGGKQQTIDMRLRLLDIKFDSRDRLVGISSEENCVVRVNDNSGAGFVRFGVKGSGPGQFRMPEGIAIDSKDRIYIADSANHRIVRIDDLNGSGWVSYGWYGSGVGRFNFPRAISIDRRDRIYVADTYNPRIVRIDDMNGSGWATYGETAETRMDYAPRNVITDKFNRIYISVAEADQVIRVDDLAGKGKKVLQFKRDMTASKRPGTLGGPCSIVVVKPVEASNPIR